MLSVTTLLLKTKVIAALVARWLSPCGKSMNKQPLFWMPECLFQSFSTFFFFLFIMRLSRNNTSLNQNRACSRSKVMEIIVEYLCVWVCASVSSRSNTSIRLLSVCKPRSRWETHMHSLLAFVQSLCLQASRENRVPGCSNYSQPQNFLIGNQVRFVSVETHAQTIVHWC